MSERAIVIRVKPPRAMVVDVAPPTIIPLVQMPAIVVLRGAVTQSNLDVYEGDYTATPSTTEQVLETKDKVMADDVTVLEIPYFETGNPAGGYTVYIGKDVGING